MGQFVHDGILYEELPNGKARVVGPAQDGGQGGQVFSLPNPKAQFEAPQAQANLEKTNQEMAFAREEQERKRREWNATHFPDGTPKPEAAKPASADPDRIPQIRSALQNIKRLRDLSKKTLAVGGYSESAKNVPLLGGLVGQNRRDVEGALQMVQGDLIQQQIARLSQMNGDKGVASIANSETEAQRMASSIANLDPNQGLAEFTRGLDRAEQFYRRQFANLNHANLNDPKERQRYGIAMDGSSPPSAPAIDGESGPRGSDMGLATGDQKFTPDEAGSRLATELARNGMSDEQINAAMTAAGFAPLQPNSIKSVREYLKQNPGFKGTVSGVGKFDETSLLNKAAASPVGTFFGNVGVAGSAGLPVLFGGQDAKQAFDLANEANPKSAFAGGTVGGISAAVGTGKLLAPFKLAGAAPLRTALLGDTLYGATYGGATADEGSRGTGALLGAGGAFLGNQIGTRAISPLSSAFARSRGGQGLAAGGNAIANAGRSLINRPQVPFTPAPEKISSAASSLLEAVGDPNNLMPDLTDAQRLGVPFTIADANAGTRSLAGAASRRSPEVKALAENTLLPRGRGQFDRLQSALDRDTVPGLNIPEQSAALIGQAKSSARAMYPGVYQAPVISTPEIDSLLNTPSGKGALGKAMKIAADERRDPRGLGFALDENGNVILNPVQVDLHGQMAAARAELDDAAKALATTQAKAAGGGGGGDIAAAQARAQAAQERFDLVQQALGDAPAAGTAATVPGYTTQTLDYVKGGLDDMVEAYRDPTTGVLNLNREGNATNQVRASLLSEMDKLNPSYAHARAAYAGPAGEREWFLRGSRSLDATPDQIGFTLKGANPTNAQQYRLGYRSALDNRLGNVRYSSNPWENAFGSPNAQERMGVLFPQGAQNFSRQYGLEGRMAQTQRDVLGNSMTAERGLADQAFGVSPGAALAIDAAAAATTGAPPIATGLRLGMQYGKDALKVGFGKKKAEELGPMLFAPLNVAPGLLADLEARRAAYEAARSASRRRGGLFGRSAGAQSGVMITN